MRRDRKYPPPGLHETFTMLEGLVTAPLYICVRLVPLRKATSFSVIVELGLNMPTGRQFIFKRWGEAVSSNDPAYLLGALFRQAYLAHHWVVERDPTELLELICWEESASR